MPVASTGAAAPGFTAGCTWRPMGCGAARHRPALIFDLDDGQVERGEQQVHRAADQRRVDLIPVAVQRHRRGGGDPALLAPQERAPQHPRVRSRRRGPALGVVALGGGGAGFRMRAAVVLLVHQAVNSRFSSASDPTSRPAAAGSISTRNWSRTVRFHRSIFPRPCGFPGLLCTSLMSSTAADQASWRLA